MQDKQVVNRKLPLKDRSWFKLGLLFVAGFMVTFLGGFAWDVFSSLGESKIEEQRLMSQPSTIAIDPKLENELAKVMSFDTLPGVNQTRDPFNDRNNLSGDATAAATTVAANTQPSAKPVMAAAKPAPQKSAVGAVAITKNTQPQANTAAAQPVNFATPQATFERIKQRESKLRSGQDAGPLSSIFAMEDLMPIGTVSGGDGQEEVMFFSKAINQTISFPVGSRFFDGWLVGYRPDGVELNPYGQNTTHLKGWGKETKPNPLGDFSLMAPSNTPPE